MAADGGDPEAQCDLGLLFLAAGRPGAALYWLRLAAEHFYPEAMFWLGRCLIAGAGVEADERAGRDWLKRASDHGHAIARHLLGFLDDPAARLARRALDPASTEVALDALERELVLKVLEETGR